MSQARQSSKAVREGIYAFTPLWAPDPPVLTVQVSEGMPRRCRQACTSATAMNRKPPPTASAPHPRPADPGRWGRPRKRGRTPSLPSRRTTRGSSILSSERRRAGRRAPDRPRVRRLPLARGRRRAATRKPPTRAGVWPQPRSAFPALSADVQKLGVPTTTGQSKGDQEKSDSNRTHDVRNHGYRTGEIACVRPD